MPHPILPHGPDDIVLRGVDREVTAAQLLRMAGRVAAALPPPAPGSHVVFAFERDRVAGAAALLGAWAAGHGVALPPDARRGSVAPMLAADGAAVLVHDTGVGMGIDVPKLLADGGDEAALGEVVLPAQPCVVTASTPDPDGLPHTRHLDALQLEEEIARVAAQLDLASGVVVASTLSPTYWPHVLAAVLAPWRVGGIACAETFAPRVHQGVEVLVSSAFHLRSLARDLGSLRCAVSAHGALDPHTSASLEAQGCAVPGVFADLARNTSSFAVDLLGVEGVEDAAAAVLRRSGQPERWYAAVVAPGLDEEALDARVAADRRVVPELPRDANGGVAPADVFHLFGLGADGQPLERELQWEEVPGEALAYRTRIPDRYAYFEGHFPPYPVLAGAVQLHELVLPCLRRHLVRDLHVTSLSGVKFPSRILPGDEITLTLTIDESKGAADFAILRGEEKCSAGRLGFAAEGSAG